MGCNPLASMFFMLNYSQIQTWPVAGSLMWLLRPFDVPFSAQSWEIGVCTCTHTCAHSHTPLILVPCLPDASDCTPALRALWSQLSFRASESFSAARTWLPLLLMCCFSANLPVGDDFLKTPVPSLPLQNLSLLCTFLAVPKGREGRPN